MKIDDLRKKIDALDRRIVALINERASCAHEIGRIKRDTNREIYAPEREKAVYEKVEGMSGGPLPAGSLRAIYREIMSASLAIEKKLVVAYLGPEATFTHLAARNKFGGSVDYAPAASITDIFGEVERGAADYGVVPIENSNEGAVTHTLDMFADSRAKICAEIYLDISHCLMASCAPREITTIYSKAEVFGQCRAWIRENCPSVELIDCSSTARAAERAAGEPGAAAIASELAAELYGLRIAARGIEDSGRNETRFLVIGRASAGPSGDDKTSILVSISDRVGALHRMLYPFRRHAINLTKIESRPSKRKAWEYYFFIDLEGHVAQKKVAEALRELERQCLFVEHLGSYPRAKPRLPCACAEETKRNRRPRRAGKPGGLNRNRAGRVG
ncbi:MAG TPA: prephenate dehydratase [bacterium]|nr:prephenate dehydratase [Chlamydiota bacterium]HOE26674.1 prephenate dehydratase [bacterium]HQM53624.1 prephenate dehydratase [bacterium]